MLFATVTHQAVTVRPIAEVARHTDGTGVVLMSCVPRSSDNATPQPAAQFIGPSAASFLSFPMCVGLTFATSEVSHCYKKPVGTKLSTALFPHNVTAVASAICGRPVRFSPPREEHSSGAYAGIEGTACKTLSTSAGLRAQAYPLLRHPSTLTPAMVGHPLPLAGGALQLRQVLSQACACARVLYRMGMRPQPGPTVVRRTW